MIDNLTCTSVYVEKKSLLKIIGNSTTNSQGILEIDSSGNSLVSIIDSGDTPLYRLAKYTGNEGLMLYNSTTQHIQIAKEGDILDSNLDFERGTKYFIGSKLIKSTSVTGNIFTVDLNSLNVLKLFIDGREIKSYSISNNEITILGANRLIVDMFSELVVYAYETTIISGNVEFEIDYYQYDTVWNKDTFADESYFETIRGIDINCFDSVSINQTVGKTVYRNGLKKSNDTRINSVDNVIDMNIFSVSDLPDMLQYVGYDEFRMIFINNINSRTVLVNNCKVDNGISLVFEKAKNTKKFTISCGNYIDILTAVPSYYGVDRYGRLQYGSGTYVLNSHRVEV